MIFFSLFDCVFDLVFVMFRITVFFKHEVVFTLQSWLDNELEHEVNINLMRHLFICYCSTHRRSRYLTWNYKLRLSSAFSCDLSQMRIHDAECSLNDNVIQTDVVAVFRVRSQNEFHHCIIRDVSLRTENIYSTSQWQILFFFLVMLRSVILFNVSLFLLFSA